MNKINKLNQFFINNKKILISIALIIISVAPVASSIFGETLAYGDLTHAVPGVTNANFLYSWGSESFGTNVRQGLFSLRSALLLSVSFTAHGFYILNYLLPLMLIPLTYYILLGKLGIRNEWARLAGSLFALLNPVIIGDFSKAQSFWIYLTIPWTLYCIVRIFYYRKLEISSYLLLAISIFLSLGFLPPLVLPMALIFGVLGIFFLLFPKDQTQNSIKSILTILGMSAGVVLLILVLLLPYLLVAPAGQDAFKPVSLLADYYHNYYSLYITNSIRLAGNNGNGMALLGYNSSSLLNLMGFIIFAVAVSSLFIKDAVRRRLALGLMLVLIAVVGIVNLLATNMDFGAKVFQSQFIASTVRDPTKIFGVLLSIYIVCFALGLENLIKMLKGPFAKASVVIVVFVGVTVYSWPVLFGNFGLSINRQNGIEDFKLDKTTAKIVEAERDNPDRRAIVIPSGHGDELNYQSVSKSLNTIRLGGSLPKTGQMVKELQSGINNNGDNLKKILGTLGINRVYLKKDQTSYGYRMFGLLSGLGTYQQTKEVFDRQLHIAEETSEYIQYSVDDAVSEISSASNVAVIDKKVDIHSVLPIIGDTSVVQDVNSSDWMSEYYSQEGLNSLDGLKGKAQLYSTDLIKVQIVKEGTRVVINQINPLDSTEKEIFSDPISSDVSNILIDDDIYDLSETGVYTTIRSGQHSLSLGKQKKINSTYQDMAFDYDTFVGDATKDKGGQSGISASLSDDKKEGAKSLHLSTNNHTAFVSRAFSSKASTLYKVAFDYKYISGDTPRVGVYEGDKLVSASLPNLDKNNDWQRQTMYLNSQQAGSLSANLYVGSNNGGKSAALFDDMAIYEVESQPIALLTPYPYMPDYDIASSGIKIQKSDKRNLLDNGSFEDKRLWGAPGDASVNLQGVAKFEVKQTADATEGSHSLLLASQNHNAYVKKSMRSFSPDKVYKLSLDYKHVSGKEPTFTLWQSGTSKAVSYGTLRDSTEWKTYTTTFIPDAQATGVTLYLYSPSSGENTVNEFDNVSIVEQPLVGNYLIEQKQATHNPDNIVKSWSADSPVSYKIEMTSGNGLIRLNDSYHKGWRAFYVPQNYTGQNWLSYLMLRKPGVEINAKYHALVDGFANGWAISSSDIPKDVKDSKGNYKVVLEYWPEREYLLSLILSMATLSSVIIYLIINRFLKKKK